MNKINILAIAPYGSMKQLIDKNFKDDKDVCITTCIGSMEKGVEAAREKGGDFDIIISRANTAELISNALGEYVVDIGIGYYDMLRALKAAESIEKKSAFLGFHRLADVAETLVDLLHMNIDIFRIESYKEAGSKIDEMKMKGYEVLVCDMVPYSYAKYQGLNTILVTSGIESIKIAVENAKKICQSRKKERMRLDILKSAFADVNYIVFNKEMNMEMTQLEDMYTEGLVHEIKTELIRRKVKENESFFLKYQNNLYSVDVKEMEIFSETYIFVKIMKSEIPLNYSKYGITVMDKKSALISFYESIYSGSKEATRAFEGIEAKSDQGIMISGETGTGKDRVANILYARSDRSNKPLFVINCSRLNDKSWNFVTTHYNSPFTDNGNTIYISNINSLSSERQKKLLSIIWDTNMHIRNRLIFSCSIGYNGELPHVAIEYMNTLGCLYFPIRPLRGQKDDIMSACRLYVDTLNGSLFKEIAGIDSQASSVLENYTWPYNRTQLKRVMKEAYIRARGAYIRREDVEEALKNEDGIPYGFLEDEKGRGIMYMGETLEDINRAIVKSVVKQHKGNRSKAAAQLGISRTTLWRYLK